MKIRNGFVSNSSSSSFLIWAKELPTTPEEVKNKMYPEHENVPHHYYGDLYGDGTISTELLSRTLADQFNNAEVITSWKKIVSLIEDLVRREHHSILMDAYDTPEWEEVDKRMKQLAIDKACKEIEKRPIGTKIFVIEEEDDSITGSHLEHSNDIPANFDVIKISNH